MILQIHPQAENEVRSAARWYEKQRAGLGLEFLATVDAGMARIESDPQSFSRLETWREDGDVRRLVLPRFPYVIVFEVIDEIINVWSIGHSQRKPGYWSSRRRR